MIPRSPVRLVALPALLALALGAGGCDAFDEQQAFREAAFGVPNGIFRTTDGENALNGEADPDDWRSAPLYGPASDPSIVVTRRASPNPAPREETVLISVRVTGFGGVPGGLRLVGFVPGRPLVELARTSGAVSNGPYNFEFSAGLLLTSTGEGGLRRVVLLDGQGEPVTYGDVLVE